MPIEKSAGGIIFRKEKNKRKYLLLHYALGHWDFPKGHIENGESPKETAQREIQEETSLKNLQFISGFKEQIKYFYKKEKKTFLKIVIFFLIQTTEKKVKISWEHTGYKWLPYQQALKQLTFENAKELLKKANKFISKKRLPYS